MINLKANPSSRTAAELYYRRLYPNKPDAYYNLHLLNGKSVFVECPEKPLTEFLSINGLSPETIMLLNPVLETIEYIYDPKELCLAIKSALVHVEKNEDAIYVGTIHSAKSMEWSNVFIPFCNEGILPFRNAPENEERNIIYVACTRAKNNLVITWSKNIAKDSRYCIDSVQGEISSFIKDENFPKIESITHLHESF